MVVISDFAAPDVSSALKVLCRRHEVIAVRITDPREQELPDVGTVTLEDPESAEQVSVDTSDAAFRTQYAALVAESGRELAAGVAAALGGHAQGESPTRHCTWTPTSRFVRQISRGVGSTRASAGCATIWMRPSQVETTPSPELARNLTWADPVCSGVITAV